MFYLHVVYMGKGEDGRSANVGGTLPYWCRLHALYMRKLRRRRDTLAERSGRSANVDFSLVQLQNVVHAEKPGRRGGRSYDATDDQTTSREYIASVRAVRGNDTFRADQH